MTRNDLHPAAERGIGTAIRRGIGVAARHKALCLLVWAVSVLQAAIAAAVGFRALGSEWTHATLANEALRIAFLVGLSDTRRLNASAISVLLPVLVSIALATVMAAFVTPGVMHVVLDRDRSERAQTLWTRIGVGGGRAYLRSVTIAILFGVFAVMGTMAAAALTIALSEPLTRLHAEAAAWTEFVLPYAAGTAVLAILWTIADYARLIIVADPLAGAVRAWVRASVFVIRHPLTTLTVWLGFALVTTAIVWAAYHWSTTMSPARWTPLAFMFLLQQGLMLARSTVRVASIGAEAHVATSRRLLVDNPLTTDPISGDLANRAGDPVVGATPSLPGPTGQPVTTADRSHDATSVTEPTDGAFAPEAR